MILSISLRNLPLGLKEPWCIFLIFSQIILGSIFFYEAFLEIKKGQRTLLHLFCDPCNIKIITELTPGDGHNVEKA